ncbi:MAG: formamidopyrimidine-DNA glycosylase, partial [Verrucomicrobia bacterium]|nr:formamidopyrimidine-DNA glycosylase [Verrucomicrobiota bacterium]
MPELPDITMYLEALEKRIVGQALEGVRLASPFLLRTAVPPLQNAHGRTVRLLRRLGKRIAIGFDSDLWLVLHLMIAGRLHWLEPNASIKGKNKLGAFDFSNDTLLLTEVSAKKRAALHVVNGEPALTLHDPGGLEVFAASIEDFAGRLTARNHTLKHALTDPHLFSGIGNAYSDEILHHARLSPIALTQKLTHGEIEQLFRATRETLAHWIEILRTETGDGFPEHVTAFREGMAVHGKFGKPCPVCGMSKPKCRDISAEAQHVLDHGHIRLLTSPEDIQRCDALIVEHHYLHAVTLAGE